MTGLNKKLRRDVKTLRWQIASIALVVGSGIAVLISTLGTYRSLQSARARFYAGTSFADIFVRLSRAPETVGEQLARIDGVAAVETRLTFDVPLDLEGVREPMVGRVISLPAPGRAARSRLIVERGRLPDPHAAHEVAINEAFAAARHLDLGHRLAAVLNGRRDELTIVGLVISAEHITALPPGSIMPDDEHFGVLWVSHEALARSYDAEGTFDEAVLWLAPGASETAVLGAVDRVLVPYGGYGAYGRSEQPAFRFVESELAELEVEATVLPVIFLLVAAFLVNVVLARLVTQERTQIASLRALGFRVGPIARHYFAFAAIVVALGTVLGILLGVPAGLATTEMYKYFFRFPDLHFELEPQVLGAALLVSLLAAAAGALAPARRIARLAPAEALQPPAPHAFHQGWLERSGLARRLPPSLRLVARNVVSRPTRTATAVLGVAAAMGILVVGAFWNDAFIVLLDYQFRRVQREDATVAFVTPRTERAVRELAHVPGVRFAEGVRVVPSRLSHGRRSKRIELIGLSPGSTLRRLVTRAGVEVPLPGEGLVISGHLAKRLQVERGGTVTLDVLEGERAHHVLTVALVVDERLGMSAYMARDALQALLAEGPSVSAAFLAIEPGRERGVHQELRGFPGVAAVTVTRAFKEHFEATLMEVLLVFSFVLTLLGALVVVGVVYNATRILVAEREREFATLRVLGFSRADISESLLLELAVQVLPALVLGALIGYGLSATAVRLFGPEDLSIPLVISARTWGLSLGVVLASAVGSALAVRRRLDHLDLVAVLKVRE